MAKEPTFLTDPKHIAAWLKPVGVKGYMIHPDGVVDVAGNVDLDHTIARPLAFLG